MELTFNLVQIVSWLPAAAAGSLLFMHRKWVWESRRGIATTVSIGSIVVGIATAAVNYGENQSVRAYEANKAEQVRLAALSEEDRADELERKAVVAEQRKTKEERYLPGEWGKLYATVDDSNYFEAKFQAIESFTRRYALDDVPPLPAGGFNMILAQVSVTGNEKQTTRQIHRCRDALRLYITPFPDPDIKLASHGAGNVSLALLDTNENEG